MYLTHQETKRSRFPLLTPDMALLSGPALYEALHGTAPVLETEDFLDYENTPLMERNLSHAEASPEGIVETDICVIVY
ncbi:hypothetical protein KIPB_015084 [Kipferlia bialata]|uniref:Uncharacterized protein n=1 Tax=Kipferlia bialata TaxID=797122 RepID=A0A9K3DA46_9EUKA|nr:hypothetical protein KIPB_015084 [Kipferlia bialata]|eukprot:g15084.t1